MRWGNMRGSENVEDRRGYESAGDLWCPGFFGMDLESGEEASLVASTISYRHAVARHSSGPPHGLDQELQFLAHALTATEAS